MVQLGIKMQNTDKHAKQYNGHHGHHGHHENSTHHIHKPKAVRPMVIQTYSMETIWPEVEERKLPVPYKIKTDNHHNIYQDSSPPPCAPKATYTQRDDLSPIRRAIDEYIEKHMKEGDIYAVHNLGRMLLDRVSHIL
jgi:hypothetical protein